MKIGDYDQLKNLLTPLSFEPFSGWQTDQSSSHTSQSQTCNLSNYKYLRGKKPQTLKIKPSTSKAGNLGFTLEIIYQNVVYHVETTDTPLFTLSLQQEL